MSVYDDMASAAGYCGDEADQAARLLEERARAETEAALLEAAAEANERIERCHEVVACPKCKQPVGARCVNVRYQAMPRWMWRETAHPHRERWTLVQAPR